ncbi:alpha-mannosidase [Bifidobacterium stellenboschense]|uniref:Alpha-mannosidase n=1 Tax=Bifidobacterium stellenboschense TaxID=762211 RepID=A0A087E090_9BIFI|nr:alpha-mannosidase [Bifidobacterium stellenboschense]KFJ01191.1 alpha-mannosidase [Bifidobacterium stellenboschense]
MAVDIDRELVRCDRVIAQRIAPYVHATIAPCDVRAAANPGEPEPADAFLARARAGTAGFRPFSVPGPWGTTWGTTWFEICGRVDREATRGRDVELVTDLGWNRPDWPGFQAEGLVYRPDGTVVKAVNPRNRWVPLVRADGTDVAGLDADGRFTLYLEAACNPDLSEAGGFAPTMLGGDPTGVRDLPYAVNRMDVTLFDRDLHALMMDLETVSGLIRELPAGEPRRWRLAGALRRALDAYDERDRTASVPRARAALADVLALPAAPSAVRHIAVGHAHIDTAWLWPMRETRRKVARTVANVLALMDEDPDMTFVMSSARHYAWLEHDHHDLFTRMRRRIDEGRFIPVGGMWVETDALMPTGESLVRQFTAGLAYFRERLGVRPHGVWLPDSFGFAASLPQIARRAGFDWFLTGKLFWNDTNPPRHHAFLWEGIDGTRILAHMPPSATYGSTMGMDELMRSQRKLTDKDLVGDAIILYGHGDGGGGPTREMTARIRRAHDLEGAPRVDFGTPDRLFAALRRDLVGDAHGADETPVHRGELYLELHRGTTTAQQEMKRYCREEESLLRVVDRLTATALVRVPGYEPPRDEIDRIWKRLLVDQFHDILPGTGIARVHREARETYARDIARLRAIAAETARLLAAHGNGGGDPSTAAGDGRKDSPDGDGRSVRAVRITRDADGATFDNGLIRARIAADGTVDSLIDLAADREIVPEGTAIGRYELLRDEPSQWDAWELERDAFDTAVPLTDGTLADVAATAHGDEAGAATAVSDVTADGVRIRTRVTLRPGARVLDFHADVDWHAPERMLKVDIPVAVHADRARFECPYGFVERSVTAGPLGENPAYESCTHRFVRVAEPDGGYAVAVVNGSTYGADVSSIRRDPMRGSAGGVMIRPSLLSAPRYPDPDTDMGRHAFDWSVLVAADMPATLAEATRLNTPDIDGAAAVPPIAVLDDMRGVIVLDWVKPADDGSGDIVLRLYEAAGGRARATLHLDPILDGCTITETDLTEREAPAPDLPRALAGAPTVGRDGVPLVFGAFQLATLRIRRRVP